MTPATPDLDAIFTKTRAIAVVGLSPDPDRSSHGVASYLRQAGFRIIPVNPNVAEVLGERAYPDLRSVSEPIDLVDVFRRSEFVPEIAEAAVAIGAKVLWLQLGVVHEQAAQRARAAGLTVVMDRCLAVEHRFWLARKAGT